MPHRWAARMPSLVCLAAGLAAGALASAAVAQAEEPGANEPAPGTADLPLQPVSGDPESSQPLQPTSRPQPRSVVPGQPSAADAVPGLGRRDLAGGGGLIREGAFLVDRRTVIIEAPTGEFIAVFGTAPESDPPMVLLPGRTLSGIEQLMRASPSRISATISGEVTAYEGRNYLMPTLYRLETTDSAQPQTPEAMADSRQRPEDDPIDQAQSQEEEAAGVAPPNTDPTQDPRVEALIRDLESGRARAPIERPTRGFDAPEDRRVNGAGRLGAAGGREMDAEAEQAGGMAEGTLVVRERGRLERQAGGRLAFVADGDLDSPPRPAMLLLPNGRLQALDRLVAQRGLAVEVRLSGRVYRSGQTVLLLVNSFSVVSPERESNLTPLQ